MPSSIGYTRFPAGLKGEENAPEGKLGAPATSESNGKRRGVRAAERALPIIVAAFLASLFIPIRIDIGPLALSPSRIVLILSVVPSFILWMNGRAGRKNWTDAFIILLAAWVAISLFVTEGLARLSFIGISMIEIIAPYLLARCFVRDKAAFFATFRIIFVIIVFLLPFAAIESISGIQVISRILDPLFSVIPAGYYPPRLGLYRAQTVFEHAILSGVVMAFMFSPVFFSFLGRGISVQRSFVLASPVLVATFFSLSAGAYIGLFVQCFLISWFFATTKVNNRWWILLALAVAAYIFVDIFSNRTPFQVFASYVAFDQHTAYWRVLIFRFGIESVWGHPVFGIGLDDWARPAWMYSSSVDNLWLVFAMRHGIPGFVFLSLGYLSSILYLAFRRNLDLQTSYMRVGLIFSLVGLAVCIATVHLWNAAFLFFMFMLGVGGWMNYAARDRSAATVQTSVLGTSRSSPFRREISSADERIG